MDQKFGPDWVTDVKEGYRTKTMQIGNAIVTVHRPILDPEERARREARIKEAAQALLRELYRKGYFDQKRKEHT